MSRSSDKTIPEEILAEAAESAYQRISHLRADAPPVYHDLLDDMAKRLLDPDVKMSHIWADSRLNPSGHIARLGALLGAPPWTFICRLRLDFAARLLANPRIAKVDGAIIAVEAGFNSYSALSEAFKIAYGMTPIAYRKACKAGTAITTAELRDGGADLAAGPGAPQTADAIRRIRKSFNRVDGLILRGRTDAAFTELDHAAAWIAEQGDPKELTAEIHARRGAVYHRRAELLVRELDLDNACSDLEKAHGAYHAAGELPPTVRRIRKAIATPDDVRAALTEALCSRCAPELKTETGRSVREHLSRALEPLPNDLDWFQVCCEPCYRVVWEAAGKARLGLMDDAWKAVWLAAHAYPVEEVPPSLARYVRALDESEILTHKGQGPRLELCRLAVETARELGDPLREAYALCFVANALRAMGRFEEAWRALRDAKEGCQADPWATAFHALMEGHLAAQEKMWQVALEQLGNARSLYSRLDSYLAAIPLVDQGAMFFDQGDYEASGRSYEEALETLDHRRDPLLAGAVVPFNLAVALAVQGRTGDAKVALNRCEFDRAAEPGMMVNELFVAGCLELDNGRPEEALRLLGETAGLAESLDRLHDKALAIFYSVEPYARLGNRQKAMESATEALGLFRALGCKQDTLDAFAKLRQQLEAAVIDAAAVAATVRRLAREQGGWLPETSGAGLGSRDSAHPCGLIIGRVPA